LAERYITDEQGRRTAVVLDIEEYEALVKAAEEAEDQRIHDEAVAEMEGGAQPRPLEEVAAEIEGGAREKPSS
jgi:hypothetical protein